MVAIARGSSGRCSMDRGMAPRPMALTEVWAMVRYCMAAQIPQAVGDGWAVRASAMAPGSQSVVREKRKPSAFARALLMA